MRVKFERSFGTTREVFLISRFAIKIPTWKYGWRQFLRGLLANMQEADFSRSTTPGLCPVVLAVPGGWITVMRRARIMTDLEWQYFDAAKFCEHDDYRIPAEYKSDSFGWIGNEIVAVDYGN